MKASAPPGLAFLKLGGSLLGNKAKPRSYRGKAVERLGAEIKRALAKAPGMKLLLAHGGGGPAHEPAKRFRTRDGLRGRGGWPGFSETRRGVLEMSRRVLATLSRARCFPILISPCAGLIADGGVIAAWDVTVIRAVLSNGQVPLIHGDAVLDRRRGFAIVSTEELFAFLASRLRPKRIVLACDVDGVYLEHPGRGRRPQAVKVVDRHNWPEVRRALAGSGRESRWDVTGGMAAKVERLYGLVRRFGNIEARIVSGLVPGAVEAALLGDEVGTLVRYA